MIPADKKPSTLKNNGIFIGKEQPPRESEKGKIILSDGRSALYSRSFFAGIEKALDKESKFDIEDDTIWIQTE